MGTPDFILDIRATAGNQLLLLPGVTAVVFDDKGRVLLGKRADNGRWSTVAGIPEPGEEPADTAVREVYEETAVHCVPESVVLIQAAAEPVVYPNGDRCQYLDITFRCRATGGVARVNDDESLEVGWFAADELPELDEWSRFRVERAMAGGPLWFQPPGAMTLPAH
ncbi:NUDIX hydrolase [Streptomyces albipurpureus]|uniref:NUDIX domain-containing protein n=1 Tax=Streptomyces albipurpureus TaxID=2897419 RepID=A0ABT0UQR4_9ACTN|nr:NUDIX domain-containing protein [Streptomyces sp. CWNU-1]MCM2390707.1 NUDIX domain-containing protein [Streptomyces sp. CWNU-1]